MPGSQVWSVLFFLMLLVVGLDSQLVHVQTIVGALTDAYPRALGRRKLLTTALVCLAGLVLGVVFVTQGGVHVLELVDTYISSVSVMLLALVELLVLGWIYGGRRLYSDIEMMIGSKPPRFWLPFWMFLTPIFILVLWSAGLVSLGPPDSSPRWAAGVGWVVALLPLLPLPICAAITLATGKGSFVQRVGSALRPSLKWKPALPEEETEPDVMMKAGTLELLEAREDWSSQAARPRD